MHPTTIQRHHRQRSAALQAALATVLVAATLITTAGPRTPASAAPVWHETRIFTDQNGGGPDSLALYNGLPRATIEVKTEAGWNLYYAWCDAACDDASSWRSVFLATGKSLTPMVSTLQLDPAGRPHIVHGDDGFRYTTCQARCELTSSWRSTMIDPDYGYTDFSSHSTRLDAHGSSTNRDASHSATSTTPSATSTARHWPTGGEATSATSPTSGCQRSPSTMQARTSSTRRGSRPQAQTTRRNSGTSRARRSVGLASTGGARQRRSPTHGDK